MENRLFVSPLLDGMVPDGTLPVEHGSCTYPVIHEVTGTKLFVKRISVPESSQATDALLLAGKLEKKEDAAAYYQEKIDAYRKELNAFASLSQSDFICGFLRYQVIEKSDFTGYDLYILSRRLEALPQFLKNNAVTQKQAVQLGIDLCQALSALRDKGFVHTRLKPNNVFFDKDHFCIGDLGLVELEHAASVSFPAKSAGAYTPPELCLGNQKVNATTDLYAVGMILYTVFNGGMLPFEGSGITPYQASQRRIHGETLPSPIYADYELDSILRKACAVHPEDRYQTPEEFLNALNQYSADAQPKDTPVVPPLVHDLPIQEYDKDSSDTFENDEDFAEEVGKKETLTTDPSTLSEDFRKNFAPQKIEAQKKKANYAGWIAIALVLVLLLCSAAIAYYYFTYSAITVDKIAIIDRGIDYLTVEITCNDPDDLIVTCANSTDNYSRSYWGTGIQTFADLEPSTMYDITVSSLDWHYLKGQKNTSAATDGITTVSDFTVVVNDDGSADVSIQVSGPDPASWELTCTDPEGNAVHFTLTDHKCTISELEPNILYTLSLDPGAGYFVTGKLETTVFRTVAIHADNLTISYDDNGTLLVSWTSDSSRETDWTVTCSGSNGSTETAVTQETSYSFTGIMQNAVYYIAVNAPDLDQVLIGQYEIKAGNVSNLTAEESDGTIRISWDFDNPDITPKWTVTVTADTYDYEKTFTTDDNYVDVDDLLPSAGYTAILGTLTSDRITGDFTVSFTTSAAPAYSEHDIGSPYVALYKWPGENWTRSKLSEARRSYLKGSKLVMLIQLDVTPKARDEEDVNVLLLTRDENGNPVEMTEYDTNWTDLWDGQYLAIESDVPDELGTYTLELYFNHALVLTKDYTSVEEEQ